MGMSMCHHQTDIYRFIRILLALLCAVFFLGVGPLSYAQSHPVVSLTGTTNGKAMVIVDGSAPKVLSVGQEFKGVKLENVQGDTATFTYRLQDNTEKKFTLKIGLSPAQFEGMGGSNKNNGNDEIVLTADALGHYVTTGYINDKSITFMVDTGASSIAIDVSDARRMGINYENAPVIQLSTANGVTTGWVVNLRSVRVQGVEVNNVEATVGKGIGGGFALLGNTFLKRFDITQTNKQLVLKRRY